MLSNVNDSLKSYWTGVSMYRKTNGRQIWLDNIKALSVSSNYKVAQLASNFLMVANANDPPETEVV